MTRVQWFALNATTPWTDTDMTRPADPASIERDEKALRLQESGLTLAVIAERLGVNRNAVHMMTARAKDRREAEDASLS